MPAINDRHLDISVEGIAFTVFLAALWAAGIFGVIAKNKRYAAGLLTKGMKVNALVSGTETKIRAGYHSTINSKLTYEFSDRAGHVIVGEYYNPPEELMGLKTGDRMMVAYDPEKPSKNFPEVVMRSIADGKRCNLRFWF